ncbi:hypothetical protein Tcan_01746, partial [Toxocara canis]
MRSVLVIATFALCVFAVKQNETEHEQNSDEFVHSVLNLTFPAESQAVMLDTKVLQKVLQRNLDRIAAKRIKAALIGKKKAKKRQRRAIAMGDHNRFKKFFWLPRNNNTMNEEKLLRVHHLTINKYDRGRKRMLRVRRHTPNKVSMKKRMGKIRKVSRPVPKSRTLHF